MKALFQTRRTRLSHRPRTRRAGLAAACVAAERLEPRQMLAADGLRPLLEQASTLVMDSSMGPNPVVMTKSQVVGTDVKSFVISHVPEGSVVEKWDAATEQWVDVSTMPTSSNPQELMRLLANRYIKEGDTIQWRPKAGVGAAAQQAFEMIGWDDGSELPGVSPEAPSAVQNLAVNPTGVGELTVSWDPPATGDATSYSITMTKKGGKKHSSTTYVTSDADYTFTGLSPANGYSFSVTASNAEATSSAVQDKFGQAPVRVDGYGFALTTGLDGSIWVANYGSNTIQQIVRNDNGVWTTQATINVSQGPSALTTGLDGSIWVANYGSNSVQQIVKDKDSGVWAAQAAIGVGTEPAALTTGHDGSIWAANHGTNTVQQIVKNDNDVWTTKAAIDVGQGPNALTTGLDGSIWVANNGSSTIQQIVNDNGVWTADAAITAGELPKLALNEDLTSDSGPNALTTGLDGSIWAASNYGVVVNLISTMNLFHEFGPIGFKGQSFVQQFVNNNGTWTSQQELAGSFTTHKQQDQREEINFMVDALTTGLDGSVWVTGLYKGTVQRIANSGGMWVAQEAIDVGFAPKAFTTGLDGSIWVANAETVIVTSDEITPGVSTVTQILAPPNAPFNLAAVFDPAPSKMTLGWQPPVIDGGSPVISYTATVAQGGYTKTVTTSDISCVFDGLTLGSGPTYFTVTATNFAGVSNTATLQIDASGNTIPKQHYRGIGITTDGVPATGGGFDGSWNTYSWEAMGDTSAGGALVGSSLVSGGLSVDVDPNQPDFAWGAGQTIEVTGSGSVLTLAGAAVNGGQTHQQFTLTFTDGSTATWTQSLSDWCDPSAYANESIISTQPYLNTASGGTDATTNHIYSYGYTLPEGKTLESITLPNNPNVRIFGAALSDPMAVDLSWNAYGLVVANNQVPNSQGFDGHGNYYNANYDGSSLGVETSSNSDFDFMQITWGGATFDLGPAPNHYSQSNNRNGNNNFVQADGQTIDVVSGDFSTLLMIGAAANGGQTDQPITLTFTDGSTTTWTQTFTDWANSNGNKDNSPPSAAELEATNEALVATTTWVNQVGNNRSGYNRFVYGYSFDIPSGKTLASITLPNNRNVGILGMALV